MSNSTQQPPTNPAKTSLGELGLILGVAVAVALGMSMWMRSAAPPPSDIGGLPVGAPAPPVEAAEWVNGEPTDEPGQVRLVHAWFYGCPYCWKEAPELVRLHEKYGDRVEFVGLAAETVDSEAQVRDYVTKNNISWPNGFGQPFTALEGFEARAFPAIWVLGRDGQVVWNRDSEGSLEAAIEKALAG